MNVRCLSNSQFNCAIKFPDGTYYNGQRDSYNPALSTLPYCGQLQYAHLLTEFGANFKIESNPLQFAGCVVERTKWD